MSEIKTRHGAEPRSFTIAVSEGAVADLQRRLEVTRLPAPLPGGGWSYGVDLDYLESLLEYWRAGFDWRSQERRLNKFHHYTVEIDGLTIHFLHERSRAPDSIPLLLTHGWPSSFLEFVDLVPLLVDPASHRGGEPGGFDVVVPSLPGYAFSDQPKDAGITGRVHEVWAKLMTEHLGYPRFGAFGGDIGAGVTARLAMSRPDCVAGIMLTGIPGPALGDRPFTAAEQAYVEARDSWMEQEAAYAAIQATSPHTIGAALNDSPAGLAAWIVEKLRAWSDCDGAVERRFSKDQVLTNVSLYWFTETIASSFLSYWEQQHSTDRPSWTPVEVPTAVALFPRDLFNPPREWAERSFNVVRWSELPRGGHFPAAEEPQLVAHELRAFFAGLR